MRYPKEALVFEVLNTRGAPVPEGSVVELDRCEEWGPGCWTLTCGPAFTQKKFQESDNAVECEVWRGDGDGWYYLPSDLKPLTPAAVELLDGVKDV